MKKLANLIRFEESIQTNLNWSIPSIVIDCCRTKTKSYIINPYLHPNYIFIADSFKFYIYNN
jgi:hypothetical protein